MSKTVFSLIGLGLLTFSVQTRAATYPTETFKFSTQTGDMSVGSSGVLAALEGRFKARKQKLSQAQLRQVPLNILVTSAAGEVNLNLKDLNLTALEVQTQTGDVSMAVQSNATTRGTLKINTAAGRVQLQSSGQAFDFKVKNSTAEVSLELMGESRLANRLDYQGSAGSLKVKSVAAFEQLKIQTQTGDVTLELNSKSEVGARLEYTSAAGMLSLKGSARLEQLTLQSETGDINIWLPNLGKTVATVSNTAGKLTVYVPKTRSLQLDNPQTVAGNISVSSAVSQDNANPNSAVFKVKTQTGDVTILPLQP